MPVRSLSAERIAMLVGPGVLRAGPDAVLGLRAFAAAVGVSVVNTYGAKGVFRWDSPYHGGTVGLQERDWELAGLMGPDAVDLVLTSGVDRAEAVGLDLSATQVVDLDPTELGAAAADWADPPREPVRPPIYAALAAVAGPLYAEESDPPNPARAAAALADGLPEGGLVVAEPGRAGWWIGRTFPTQEAGSVVVPSSPEAGVAARRAVAAAREGREVILVVDREREGVVLPSAAELDGLPLRVQVWADGDTIDFSAGRLLEAVAGPLTAWPRPV